MTMALLGLQCSPSTHSDGGLFFMGFVPRITAGAAMPSPGGWIDVCIGVIIRMTVWAMSFCLLLHAAFYSSLPAKNISSMRDWFKMRRIDAGGVSAEVIKIVFLWYRTNKKLIAKPMRINQLVSIPKDTVSKRSSRCDPKPTCIGFIDLWPKSLFRRFGRACKFAGFLIVVHARHYI